MQRLIAVLVISFLITSCVNNQNRSADDQQIAVDSSIIIQKRIDSISQLPSFINAKWWLYCWECDDSVKKNYRFHDTSTTVCNLTMGELDLEFQKTIVSDKYISYFFKYRGKGDCPIHQAIQKNIVHDAITVQISNDSVCAFADEESQIAVYSGPNPKSRLYKPLQPEVIKYIRKNKDKIHPWFRKEAIKRGVITE